jgi:hypothetical protein
MSDFKGYMVTMAIRKYSVPLASCWCVLTETATALQNKEVLLAVSISMATNDCGGVGHSGWIETWPGYHAAYIIR